MAPRRLPEAFRYSQARRLGVSDRRLRRLREAGEIELVSRGLYRRTSTKDPVDLDLLEIAHRAPEGTLCLVSALSRHGLTDHIPADIDVAIPRGKRPPRLQTPVTWHHFATDTYQIGRTELPLDSGQIGIYSPERTIIDLFRLRHQEGQEVAVDALRAWLRRPGARPSQLLAVARHFPTALPALRSTLEVLL